MTHVISCGVFMVTFEFFEFGGLQFDVKVRYRLTVYNGSVYIRPVVHEINQGSGICQDVRDVE